MGFNDRKQGESRNGRVGMGERNGPTTGRFPGKKEGLDVNGNGINVFKLNGIVRRVLLCSDPFGSEYENLLKSTILTIIFLTDNILHFCDSSSPFSPFAPFHRDFTPNGRSYEFVITWAGACEL